MMKSGLSSRALFALGFVLLIGTNLIVLSGVALNRSGDPEAEISLTERELQLSHRRVKENSGLSMQLHWRIMSPDKDTTHYSHWGTPAWFTADKLEELGFRIDRSLEAKDKAFRSGRSPAKEVFIVLEYDGELYREAVRRAASQLKRAGGEQVQRERISASRLFAVDAGLDPGKLREKYPNRAQYIIAKGLVQPEYRDKKEREDIYGQITELSIERIHVPLKYRKMFDTVLTQNKSTGSEFSPPRYQVELAYGHRFEPWIVSVQQLGDTSQEGFNE